MPMPPKPPRSQTVLLHLRPGDYPSDLTVVKIAKSENAVVTPGDVIVKAKITVPGNFFDVARPYVEIEFPPEAALEPPTVTITTETE